LDANKRLGEIAKMLSNDTVTAEVLLKG